MLFFLKVAIKILVSSGVIIGISKFLPGVTIKNNYTAVIVAVVYSVVNFLFFTLLSILSLPLMILTLGLFVFIINAVLLWITDKLIEDFEISSFPRTIAVAFLISLANNLLNWFI